MSDKLTNDVLSGVYSLDTRRGPRLSNIQEILRELGHIYRQRSLGKMSVEELNARAFTLQTMLSAKRALMGHREPFGP